MPNVTWMEPQIVTDLLGLNVYAAECGTDLPGGHRSVAVVSPWFSNVELTLGPGIWRNALSVGRLEGSLRIEDALARLQRAGWTVRVGVLAFGRSFSGLTKRREDFSEELRFLRACCEWGAEVYLCPDLHAKGIVTPLGVITGGTNVTRSGLYLQGQNSNFFPADHVDYAANRDQLMVYCADRYRMRNATEL